MGIGSHMPRVGVQQAYKMGKILAPEARVHRFSPGEVLNTFCSVDGETWGEQIVRDIRLSMRNQQAGEPASANRAHVICTESDKQWELRYPRWFQPFKAGQLFLEPQEWQAVWKEHGQVMPRKLWSWITCGYSVKVHHNQLGAQPGRNHLTTAEQSFALQQLTEWEEMGAVEQVPLPADPNVRVCNMVVAYRNGRMDRICWSGNPINQGVVVDSFKMETLHQVCQIMKPGDFAFSLDFKKGFMQIPLKRQFREYTYMRLGKRCYRWNVLMFGLATAPKDFSYVVKKVLALLRQQGIRNAFFIDDIIHFTATIEEACALRLQVLDLLYRLGFYVSWKKSLLEPGQLIQHLGLDVCTVDRSIWVPEYKVKELINLAGQLLTDCRRPVPARRLSSFIGKLISMQLASPGVLILTKGLSSCLSQLETRDTLISEHGQVYTVRDYDGEVLLSDLAVEELRFWVQCIWQVRGTPFRDVIDVFTFVDACPTGGGAVVVERPWALPDNAKLQVSELRAGAWQLHLDVQSTMFELLNIAITVSEFGSSWEHRTVQILTDNVGAAFIAGRGCLKNAMLHALSLHVWQQCLNHHVRMCFQYLAGDGIIAAGADGLSRDSDYGDCKLKRWAFQLLWGKRRMQVDLFCSPSAVQYDLDTGKQLLAVSPYYMENQVGHDGLVYVSDLVMFAFPPTSLLMPLLGRVVRLGLKCVVVGPVWSERPWWHWVAALPASNRQALGSVKSCISTGLSGQGHPFGPSFDARAAKAVLMEAWFFNM
jgi:Reverse transcriptase (RNA-dependent DNA polymerase)